MAHYALLDENNLVIDVFVGRDEGEDGVDWEAHYGAVAGQTCKRTSYNTDEGAHKTGGTPFRKNYAGIGYAYDPERDAFIPPSVFSNWVLDENTCTWVPPVPYPTDDKRYKWDQLQNRWIEYPEDYV
jgi:hypothetical protein